MISIEQHINHYLEGRCQFARCHEAAILLRLGEEVTMATLMCQFVRLCLPGQISSLATGNFVGQRPDIHLV